MGHYDIIEGLRSRFNWATEQWRLGLVFNPRVWPDSIIIYVGTLLSSLDI